MSGAGYDAVVDVDDEVCVHACCVLFSPLPPSQADTGVPRATSDTPTSRKTSSSTTRPSQRPRIARARAAQAPDCRLLPRLDPVRVPRSVTSGPSPSTPSSSMSTPRLFSRVAGRPCTRGLTSWTCWRATRTCTVRSGSRRPWSSSCSSAAPSASGWPCRVMGPSCMTSSC